MAGARNSLSFHSGQNACHQLPNQGFSALPLSHGVGCPATLPGPEDMWSCSASFCVKRVERNFSLWKQRTIQLEIIISQVAKYNAPAPGPWGPPLRVQGKQEDSFSSLPSLLGRPQWCLYSKLFQIRALIFPLSVLFGGG